MAKRLDAVWEIDTDAGARRVTMQCESRLTSDRIELLEGDERIASVPAGGRYGETEVGVGGSAFSLRWSWSEWTGAPLAVGLFDGTATIAGIGPRDELERLAQRRRRPPTGAIVGIGAILLTVATATGALRLLSTTATARAAEARAPTDKAAAPRALGASLLTGALVEDERVPNERQIALVGTAKRNSVQVQVSARGTISSGTGFVLRRFDDLVVIATNAHVALGADGDPGERTVIGTNQGGSLTVCPLWWRGPTRASDLALLVASDPQHALGDTARIGTVRGPGSFVVCAGNPLGEFVIGTGHVREISADGSFVHDCVNEHGSSGGPVYDSSGAVVGIETFLTPDGRGIALPLERILRSVDISRAAISARAGWTSTDASIDSTDVASIVAIGSWTYSSWHGACGPEGTSEDFASYSYDARFAHAALLCRAGSRSPAFGVAGRWWGTGEGPSRVAEVPAGKSGRIEYRPNDTDVGNNRGAMDVVVAVTR